jgi:hypothetical protein
VPLSPQRLLASQFSPLIQSSPFVTE